MRGEGREVFFLAPRPSHSSLTTFMTAPWQLDLLWGVLVGGATGAVGVPLAAVVANRWFSTRRGLVTGILTASNASGQMVFLPALAWLATGVTIARSDATSFSVMLLFGP